MGEHADKIRRQRVLELCDSAEGLMTAKVRAAIPLTLTSDIKLLIKWVREQVEREETREAQEEGVATLPNVPH